MIFALDSVRWMPEQLLTNSRDAIAKFWESLPQNDARRREPTHVDFLEHPAITRGPVARRALCVDRINDSMRDSLLDLFRNYTRLGIPCDRDHPNSVAGLVLAAEAKLACGDRVLYDLDFHTRSPLVEALVKQFGGEEKWHAMYNGPAANSERQCSLNIFITGSSYTGMHCDGPFKILIVNLRGKKTWTVANAGLVCRTNRAWPFIVGAKNRTVPDTLLFDVPSLLADGGHVHQICLEPSEFFSFGAFRPHQVMSSELCIHLTWSWRLTRQNKFPKSFIATQIFDVPGFHLSDSARTHASGQQFRKSPVVCPAHRPPLAVPPPARGHTFIKTARSYIVCSSCGTRVNSPIAQETCTGALHPHHRPRGVDSASMTTATRL
jgi:hypothetical protein